MIGSQHSRKQILKDREVDLNWSVSLPSFDCSLATFRGFLAKSPLTEIGIYSIYPVQKGTKPTR